MASKRIDPESDTEKVVLTSNIHFIETLALEPYKYTDTENTCRACASTEIVLDLAENENYSLLWKFRSCVEVELLDPLPKQLCSECITKIESFYEFKMKCEYIDQKLRDFILATKNDNCNNITIVNDDFSAIKEEHNQFNVSSEAIFTNEEHLLDEDELDQIEEFEENVPVSLSDTEQITDDVLDYAMELTIEEQVDSSIELNIDDCKTVSDNLSETKMELRNQKSTPKKKSHRLITKKQKSTYKCDTCNETFKQAFQYFKHIRSHGQQRYKCDVCDRWFAQRNRYNDHMVRHTGSVTDFECELCLKRYTNQGNLQRHIRVFHENQKGFDCVECGKSFSQSHILRVHMVSHMQERNYKCIKCKKCFKTPSNLEMHMESHIPIELRVSKRTTNRKQHMCTMCGKKFKCEALLKYHTRHHNGEKPYECKFCSKRFGFHQSLKSHLLLHTGEKPYVCNECGKAFRQLGHLKGHSLTHTGEKKEVCHICSKSFALRTNLTVHMRMHTGETPYACKVCPQTFYNSNGLKRHTQIHMRQQKADPIAESNANLVMGPKVEDEICYEEEYFINDLIANEKDEEEN